MKKFLLNRKFVLSLALLTVLISVPPTEVHAMPTASVTSFNAAALRPTQINSIMTELSRPEAQAHLMLMGVSQNELRDKLEQLDDAQLTSVAAQADAVKAAGDGGLGLIIAILVIAILIVVFVRLKNHERIN
jgi:hypothetical protein